MSDQYAVAGVRWNNNISVATITVISYDYLLLLEKEVKYVWVSVQLHICTTTLAWKLTRSPEPTVVTNGVSLHNFLGGGLLFMPEPLCFAEVILIWRLYALYNRSKLLLRVLLGLFIPIVAVSIATDVFLYSRSSVFSVQEIMTADAKYCTFHFKWGPLPVTYMSIPIVCFDILLLTLAAAKLAKHSRERRKIKVPVLNISELFNSTVPYILAPRLTISIWDMHAHDNLIVREVVTGSHSDEHYDQIMHTKIKLITGKSTGII
ncbi:hypothetical protein BDR07DRAFT_1374902 [Suillus spraguei]|nr:hypothetical protein BDR07DRAFT_1374902 [Suillus spraguei]